MDKGLNEERSLVEEELARALAVNPSPEFMARIRRRIAEEPAPGVLWVRWPWLVVVSGAAAATAWLLFVRGPASVVRPTSLPSRTIPASTAWTKRDAAQVFVHSAPVGSGAAQSAVSPEVIIDWREANALRALLEGPGALRIDVTPRADLVTANDLDLHENIEIAPIVIDPLVTTRPPEGGPQ